MSIVLRALVVTLLLTPLGAGAATTVCVDVQVKSWTLDPEGHADALAEGPSVVDPFAIDPSRYLGRMMRYEVTHEVGFEAVEGDCQEHLVVELYPLRAGWTVFARYSGHSREEKVSEVALDEFDALSERLARALLRDRPVSDTITRTNVLEADSESNLRTIDGDGHFVMALGTEARVGTVPTVGDDGQVSDDLRLLTPLSFQMGYRGKYQAWGLDAFVRGALGTSREAAKRNPTGGHVDFEGAGAFGLHFLRYLDATGMTSLYFGGGAQFQLSLFSVVRAEDDREDEDTELLYGGGLDVDLLIGYEFMRASSVHFYVQAEAHAPTYKFQTQVDSGGVDAYLPGGLLQIGMVF